MKIYLNVAICILAAAAIVMCVQGCYYDKEQLLYPKTNADSCTGTSVSFNTDIHPLIQANCATSGCHTSADAAGGVVLETYQQISAEAARINQRCIIDKTMPPGGPLNTQQLAELQCWLSSGAPNN